MELPPITYADKLKSPHWQRKRCEVMMRDDFTCVHCRSKDKLLHVHHLSYRYGNDPWNYPLENFVTLCCDCHEDETLLLEAMGKRLMGKLRNRRELGLQYVNDLIAENEERELQEAMAERDRKVEAIESEGAEFNSEGRFYTLNGKCYDEDGEPL